MLSIRQIGDNPAIAIRKARSALTANVARVMLKAANIAGGFIAKEVVTKLNKKGTGNLAGSFLPATFVETPQGIGAAAVSDLPYAKVQDVGTGYLPGGVITAKPPRKMVAIPVTPQAEKLWPREWPKDALEFIPSKALNQAVLVSSSNDQVQYVLKASVKLTGKQYIASAMQRIKADVPKKVANDLNAAMKKAAAAGGTDG